MSYNRNNNQNKIEILSSILDFIIIISYATLELFQIIIIYYI
jgi:hypothetical protein